jgi:mannose/fructose/N-acetylgalactosamine-specific phosphotransferase system component IIB
MWTLKITSTVTDSEDSDKLVNATMSITSGVTAVRLVKTACKCGVAVITDHKHENTTFVIVCQNSNDALKLITDFSKVAELRHAETNPDKPITLNIKPTEYCEYN